MSNLNVDYVKTLYMDFNNPRLTLFFKLFDFFRLVDGLEESASSYIKSLAEDKFQFEPSFYISALSEKKIAERFFEKVISQKTFDNNSGGILLSLLSNWYAAHRVLASNMKKGVDPFFLTNDELDLLIQSFGFPYSPKIISRRLKVSFLYSLIEFYHKKGSPHVFGEVLKHFGLNNTIISEWWLYKSENTGEFYYQSIPVYPRIYRKETEFIETKTFDDFNNDIHWYQTKEILANSYANTNITLPSITPYISIRASFDILKLRKGMAILQQLIQESYTFWIEYVLSYKGSVKGMVSDPDLDILESGELYIISNSPSGIFYNHPNSYVTKTTRYIYYSSTINDVVYNQETKTHHVFNGTKWVDLNIILPSNLLNNLKNGRLNKPIYLTSFQEKYSVLETILALIYLFNSSNDTTDKRFCIYHGKYSPFDLEINGIRDNIIDDPNIFFKVYEEWDSYTQRPWYRENKDPDYDYIYTNFQSEINKTDTDKCLVTYYNPAIFIQAMNANLRDELDDYIINGNRDDVFNTLILDLESYLLDIAKIIDVPFVFLFTGFDIYNTYKKVIDFFKPYRARIYSFTAALSIGDKLNDSCLIREDNIKEYKVWFGDQCRTNAYSRLYYDSSNVLDSVIVRTESVL